MATNIPAPPARNEDPWFDKRDAFDQAVRTRLNTELSDAALNATFGGKPELPAKVDGQSVLTVVPRLVDPSVMLTDTVSLSPDGAKFFTIIDVRGRLTSPIDNFYAYVSGHDSNGIGLFTGPSPVGPWAYHSIVYDRQRSTLLTSHIASPDVVWWGQRMVLTVHGVHDTGAGGTAGQPSIALTSTDGVTFTEPASVSLPVSSRMQYDDTSTSYVRMVNAGGYLLAIYQANTGMTTVYEDPPGTQKSGFATSVGWATSRDGVAWTRSRVPLLANDPGERGMFSPGIFRVNGAWLLFGYYPERKTVDLYASETLTPGTFRKVGTLFRPADVHPGFAWADAPTIYVDTTGVTHLYWGATDESYAQKGRVWHAVLDWN